MSDLPTAATPRPTAAASTPAAASADGSSVLVSMYQKAAKIYPRAVSGVFARWRWGMVALTQLIFYGLPWLTWHGRQAVLFDLDAPRFYLFGLVLQPQDLIFLALLLVLAALALFFFTAVAGRLWCGYSCPQTVYTEMFLWVERQLEGDRQARMRLDASPWGVEKALRKGGKHLAWGLLALVTGFSFVGYFVPIRQLGGEVVAGTLGAWSLFWILFYALATYGNAGWLREQICKYMCPYARFQSTMIDGDSLVIAYDLRRGEPRGARSRKADPKLLGLGDCVDCTLCVQVCPTGIDIRHGLQNECIGCAACIDVCDGVMDKLGYPKGLIRYSTSNGVAQGLSSEQMLRRVLRPRVLIYGALLLAATIALGVGVSRRSEVAMNVMRDRGSLAQLNEDGGVDNVYRLQLINRTEQPAHWRIEAGGLPGLTIAQAGDLALAPGEVKSFVLRLSLPQAQAQGRQPGPHPIELRLVRAPADEAGAQAQAGAVAQAAVVERSTFVLPR